MSFGKVDMPSASRVAVIVLPPSKLKTWHKFNNCCTKITERIPLCLSLLRLLRSEDYA